MGNNVGEQLAATMATLAAHLKECGDKSAGLQKTLDRIDRGMDQLQERVSKQAEQARADRKQDIDGVLSAMREEREAWSSAIEGERSKRERLAWWAITGALSVSAAIIATLLAIIAFFLTGGKIEMGVKTATLMAVM